jgi:hypothetical protein
MIGISEKGMKFLTLPFNLLSKETMKQGHDRIAYKQPFLRPNFWISFVFALFLYEFV